MIIDQDFINNILPSLKETVMDASKVIMEVYDSDSFDTEIKDDGSPVTKADNLANNIILKSLSAITPDLPIISEETFNPDILQPVGPYWLVDPLDGTKGFINKDGNFTVNIALIKDSKSIFGIICAPSTSKVWSGSIFNNLDLDIGNQPLNNSLRIVMSKNHQTETDKKFLDLLSDKDIAFSLVAKGSSLKLCALADNEADIYPRFGPTSEWDIAAGNACLLEKGGHVCQMLSGEPLEYSKPESILNPAFVAFRNEDLKEQFLPLISEFYKKLV